MGNKIIIELDVEDLKNVCESKEANIVKCDGCKQNIEQLLKCNIYCINFEIKEQFNENKRKHLFEDLGNLEYQRCANIEFYGYTEDSETIKELDNLIKQKRKQLKELEDGN